MLLRFTKDANFTVRWHTHLSSQNTLSIFNFDEDYLNKTRNAYEELNIVSSLNMMVEYEELSCKEIPSISCCCLYATFSEGLIFRVIFQFQSDEQSWFWIF